jgi:N6-adenosine-specific RNA methylase IME4
VNPFAHLRSDYRVIAADPPWRFKSNSAAKPGRNAMRHYDTMSLVDIAALPVKDLAAKDAALFLWITGPFLAIGAHLPLMQAWGFEPTAMGFVWIKLNPRAPQLFFVERDLATGGGFTTRKNAEFCLIGKRGKSIRQSAGVHEVIIEPRREHSRKPDEFFDRVERYSEGPYLELFARQSRAGWDCFGNESTKYDPPKAA